MYLLGVVVDVSRMIWLYQKAVYFTVTLYQMKSVIWRVSYETKYSRMDQVKFVEESL